MQSQKNITHVFVGKDLALATGTRAAMTTGQIGIFKNGSVTASDAALLGTDRFKVVLKDVNDKLIESPLINNELVRALSVDYTAPTEKKVYVGYNGTSGAIAVANDEVYVIHMNLQDDSRTFGEHPLFKMVAAFKSDAAATQTEIADALVVNANKNFEREAAFGVDYIKCGRINSAAVDAGNLLDHNATVVNGSNAITVATNLTYAATTGTLAVGDYLRIGGVGVGTALTSQVYKVTAITNLVVTLDRVVTDPSGTYATATADIEVLPAATAIAANWGLSFEAKALPFSPGKFKYAKLNFQVQIGDGFGSTAITVATAASKGKGTYYQVSEEEWDGAGNRGETYRVADFPVTTTLNAVSGKTYDCINIDFANDTTYDLDHAVASFGSLTIYTEVSQANDLLKTVFGL